MKMARVKKELQIKHSVGRIENALKQEKQHEFTFWQQVFYCGLAGGTANLTADIFYFPLDTIKTRIQASGHDVNFKHAAANGIAPHLIISLPQTFVFFSFYEGFRRKFVKDYGMEPNVGAMIASSGGEIAAALVKNPFEVIKQQMQVGLNHNIPDTAKFIYNRFGIKGFYAGLDSLIFREVPTGAIQFTFYEFLKRHMKSYFELEHLNGWHDAFNGIVAGGIAGFLTTPFDVVKTKLMTSRTNKYRGLFHCMATVAKEEGVRKLFDAALIRTAALAVNGLVLFTVYEKLQHVFKSLFGHHEAPHA